MFQQGSKGVECNGKSLDKELFTNIYLVTDICQALFCVRNTAMNMTEYIHYYEER